ncbi:MAG: YicC family protein [Candidatus Marinimicrobia bacterium]|nr:YicC family protein [Candidatus Neomarinimicrobiota bacterium]|tara:strand:- start:2487 stop:3365 length:879 start_codon:yes stop_codon:yes gene_type:complete
MLLSMTGFGSGEYSENGISVTVDIKSLNSRFLDIHLKLHRSLYEYESKINSLVKDCLKRGRITISMDIKFESNELENLILDKPRLQQYMKIANDISLEYNNLRQLDISYFLNNPEIVQKETNFNKELIENCIEKSLILALKETERLREIEGIKLGKDLNNRINVSNEIINKIKIETKSNWSNQVEKYRMRVQNICEDVLLDSQRMTQEIAILAEKKDITEELIRLKSHSELFNQFLNDSESLVGKKMNFLLQEIGREVNTIGSKTDLSQVSHLVVNLKNEIEKIREQVQNIL